MSSFFTKPASLKRKRPEGGAPRPQRTNDRSNARPTKRRETRDDSVSGSDFDDDDDVGPRPPADSDDESSESEFEGEDAAGRRTRLAERYLENTRQQIISEGFDAKDIDAELLAERMGERLKEDSAESKGKIYRWIADDYDYQNALHSQFRADSQTLTGVATCAPYIYTVSKDMTLIKWEMPQKIDASSKHTQPTKPKKLIYTRGNGKREDDFDFKHHTDAILCVAASSDGKFVATGGRDRKLIVWDAATLTPLKFFHHHRDAVTSLCFRRTTNQLYSASKDRTIKLWSLDELAYVETLFGHQDEVTDVAALNQELCVTVGARDRTARYWRVVEESQLVFRGGGSGASSKQRKENAAAGIPQPREFHEGSIDRVTMVDDEHFVTGSDNGTLSLWNIQKKKSVFTLPLAHGLDPPPNPEDVSAEADPSADVSVYTEPQPRWITALACVPFSNIIISGSWDGQLRAWKISEDKRRLEALGPIGCVEDNQLIDGEAMYMDDSIHAVPESNKTVKGVINDLAVFERGDRGKDGLAIVAAVGKEHKLGRWMQNAGKNHAMLFRVSKKVAENGTIEEAEGSEDE
ncbi:WD40 repeat-like protein, partial [Aureobasidium melanogenum]